MKKKILKSVKQIYFVLFVLSFVFISCSKQKEEAKPVSVVTTIFPAYDWARNIIGNSDSVKLELLLKNGSDLHSYQPSTNDIIKISTCDLFVYVGGESDKWIEDILKNSKNNNMIVVKLLDLAESHDNHTIENCIIPEHEHHKEHIHEIDEHIWLSLKKATKACEKIAESVEILDLGNSSVYAENLVQYKQKLENLDGEYAKVLNTKENKTLIFCDRFPFKYLTDDYGLTVYAAFSGCSAETEASFETVAFLTKKLDELKLNSVFTIDNSDNKIAQTVIKNSTNKNCSILSLDSMQSTTWSEIQDGKNYLSVMSENLSKIKEGLK